MAGRDPPGNEHGKPNACVVEQLQCGGPLHERQVTRRIFEQQGLVNHRQFKMGGGVVNWDTGVLGQQHHGECYSGKGETRVEREGLRRQAFRDHRQRCG